MNQPAPQGPGEQAAEDRKRQPELPIRVQTDVPNGWRKAEVRRDFIMAQGAFERGFEILCLHGVPDRHVSVVRRVEAGVFGCMNPSGPNPQVTDVGTEAWWDHNADDHAPILLPQPWAAIDWQVFLLVSSALSTPDNPPPVPGTIVAQPPNVREAWPLQGRFEQLWPGLRTGRTDDSAFRVVVGPRDILLVSRWVQPPPVPNPVGFPYQLCRSWGILEGIDYYYDTPQARRALAGYLP